MTHRHVAAKLAGSVLLAVSAASPGCARDPAAAESRNPAFTPPTGPMLLTRTLIRPLSDGKQILTRRHYMVQIVPTPDGYRVEGRLVEVEVEAPPSLTALAAIERGRADNGLFPMLLDRAGRIVGSSAVTPDGSMERAVRIAGEQLGRTGLPAGDVRQARSFIAMMQARQARTEWPVDVFSPNPGLRREIRSVPLGEGREGKVTIELTGTREASDGAEIASLQRSVTTEYGGDTHVTRELWRLSRPAGISSR